MQIVTIGGYGYDQAGFISALRRAQIDTFVDVRQRRGVRGRQYAFLNSSRLQGALAEIGIRYLHLKDLAPTQSVRDIQKRIDTETGTKKRDRSRLSPEFVRAYEAEVLGAFDPAVFEREIGADAKVVALFCVEGQPEACHRSLVADRLARELGVHVEHVRP